MRVGVLYLCLLGLLSSPLHAMPSQKLKQVWNACRILLATVSIKDPKTLKEVRHLSAELLVLERDNIRVTSKWRDNISELQSQMIAAKNSNNEKLFNKLKTQIREINLEHFQKTSVFERAKEKLNRKIHDLTNHDKALQDAERSRKHAEQVEAAISR